MSTSVDIEFKDFGYFDSDVTGFDDATGLPIFDRAQNSEFLANMLGALIGNGVYPNPSTNLQVIERDDAVFGVQVLPGKIWIDGRFAWPKEPILLEADPASTTADRIDIIVVERNNPDRKFSVKCITGAPAASPVPPTPERTTDVHQRVLCQYRVRKNATKINQSDILDTRMDNELCGYVTGVVEQIDGSTLFAQIQAMIDGETQYLDQVNADVQEFFAEIQNQGFLQPNVDYVELQTDSKRVLGAINEILETKQPLLVYSNTRMFVSNTGVDAVPNGFSLNTPCRTLQYALDNIPSHWGGAVVITILDDLGFDALTAPITVRDCNARAISIEGKDGTRDNYRFRNAIECRVPGMILSFKNIRLDLTLNPTSAATAIYYTSGSIVTLSNCLIAQGAQSMATHGIAIASGSNAVISNSRFSKCRSAIQLTDGSIARVAECIGDSYEYGMAVYGSIIFKSGTTPGGSIAAEYKGIGGQIFG